MSRSALPAATAAPRSVPGKSASDESLHALVIPSGPPRLTYRLAEAATMLGISRRTLERQRAAGRFPRPDLHVGKAPLWKIETLRAWIERGGR
jgi:predicted DNA-binding transcriptional regulator AlpA